MFRLVLRGIRSHLGRLILTLVSVVLGVAFVSGSFVLADSLRTIFDQVSEDAFAGVDAQVRAVEGDLNSSRAEDLRFSDSVIATVQALPEVEVAEGGLFAFEKTYTIDASGEIVRPLGPPVFTTSWDGPSAVSSFRNIEGTPPSGQEVVLDATQAKAGGFTLGDAITISLPTGEPEIFTLAGTLDFGEGGTGGAYFVAFDLPTTQRVLDADGLVDSIVVNAADGVTPEQLVEAIRVVLPEGLEAVTGEVVIGEQQADFGEFINIFGNVLLGFAVVVLFVSTFIIHNTFATLVGQRTRQYGLLRSIGASAKQIRGMVMLEAGFVGVLASILGLLGGLGVASLLKRLFSSGGAEFPDGPLEIRTRTIVVVVIVGMVVTLVSALMPALKASRVAPLEAFRSGGVRQRSLRSRLALGAVVTVPGAVLLGLGMFGDAGSTSATLGLVGVGGALTFIGVSMLSALFAGPVTSGLGLPVAKVKGVTGQIARGNASRNPQRTSATATALMIGLALISGVAVLTQSILDTFNEILEDAISADLFIFESNQGLEFSATLVDQLRPLPEIADISGYSSVEARIDGEVRSVTGFDSTAGTSVVDFGVIEGVATIGTDGLGVLDDVAAENGIALGDIVPVEFEDGFTTEVEVRAIFDDASVLDGRGWLLDRSLTSAHINVDDVSFIGLTYTEGVDPIFARSVVEEVTAAFPQLSVQDNTEFKEEAEGQIAQLQVVITGLLVLCLVVAFFGIVNTMALAVLERTREIGLLRAVGMTRRQLRTSVRWEAAIISLFGSLLGIALGLVLGAAAVIAIPDSFVSSIGIPWGQLAAYTVVGGGLGVLAAWFPARRAAKLDVLDAIATE